MATKTRSALQQIFVTGAKPIQQNFTDWLDSYRHVADLSVPVLSNYPEAPEDGDMWYNAAQNQFQCMRQGDIRNFLTEADAVLNQNGNATISGNYTGACFVTSGAEYNGVYYTGYGYSYGQGGNLITNTYAGVSQLFRIDQIPKFSIDNNGAAVYGRIYLAPLAAEITSDAGTGNLLFNATLNRFRGRIDSNYYTFMMEGLPVNITNIEEYTDNTAARAAGLPPGRVYRTGDILKVVRVIP